MISKSPLQPNTKKDNIKLPSEEIRQEINRYRERLNEKITFLTTQSWYSSKTEKRSAFLNIVVVLGLEMVSFSLGTNFFVHF